MKLVKLLSLFFYSTILNCCFFSQIAYSQQNIDSLQYYYSKTLNPTQNNDLTSAYLFYKNHIQKSLNQKDTLTAVQGIRMLAIIEFNLGFLQDSEETSVFGLKLLDKLKDTKTSREAKKGIYNQLGKIYRNLNNQDNALQYYNKALQFSENLNDSLTITNNKANIYRDLNQLKKAINELTIVYKSSLKQPDTILIARTLDNLGFIQSKLNLPEAIHNLKNSLNYRLKIRDTKGIYASLSHLSKYYKERGNKLLAIKYANQAFKISQDIKSSSFIEDATSSLLELHDDKRVVSYIKLNDSITKAKKEQQNKFASIQYDVAKEKSRADKNEFLKEKEKGRSLLFLFIGISILIIATLLILYLNSKFKKEKVQQVYITETRISKKVHDEVANDVYQVMTKLQEDSSIKENILDDLDNIYSRTRDISRENSALDVNDHFEITLNDLFLSYKNDNINIITRNIPKIDWNAIEAYKKITLYRILQELMVNMKKHSQANNVALTFNESNNRIGITYTDNGIGCKIKKGTGLLNMENRIKSIKGTIIFESEINKGFKVIITV